MNCLLLAIANSYSSHIHMPLGLFKLQAGAHDGGCLVDTSPILLGFCCLLACGLFSFFNIKSSSVNILLTISALHVKGRIFRTSSSFSLELSSLDIISVYITFSHFFLSSCFLKLFFVKAVFRSVIFCNASNNIIIATDS